MRNVLKSLLSLCVGLAANVANAQVGPDVIVGDLQSIQHYGIVGDIRAYSIGTTSCNIGDMDLLWISSTNQHPVIAQNMFRLSTVNGATRFEQLGQSWLKHAFTAINNGICGQCNGHLGSVLGVGCSDPYGSGLNGQQSLLGPKSEVNAYTGVFPYPYGIGWQQSGNAIYKRLQVRHNDIDPAQNPGALYFIDGHYVTQDDATWGNQNNNASYRRINVTSASNVSVTGTTVRTEPGIFAWRTHGLGVNNPDPNVLLTKVVVPGDGIFWVGTRATDLGGGIWHYEYAVHNLNSHRSGGSFTVPIQAGTVVTNTGFHDVDYHSGEPYDNTDWSVAVGSTSVTWNSPQTYAQNPNSNALRWGTLYNFRFDANVPPTTGNVTIGLFRPGSPTEVAAINVSVPGGNPPCPGDFNGDGVVGLDDLTVLLASYGSDDGGDMDGDGDTDLEDLTLFLAAYGTTC